MLLHERKTTKNKPSTVTTTTTTSSSFDESQYRSQLQPSSSLSSSSSQIQQPGTRYNNPFHHVVQKNQHRRRRRRPNYLTSISVLFIKKVKRIVYIVLIIIGILWIGRTMIQKILWIVTSSLSISSSSSSSSWIVSKDATERTGKNVHENGHDNTNQQQKSQIVLFPNVPFHNNDINIWIDINNHNMFRYMNDPIMEQTLYQQMTTQCIPNDTIDCRYNSNNNNVQEEVQDEEEEHIAIIRPPGVLGSIVEDYLVHYISRLISHQKDTIKRHIHILPNVNTSDIQKQQQELDWTKYNKIIRPVVMPILLEVMDLLLQWIDVVDDNHNSNSDNNDIPYTIQNITIHDMIHVVQILVQWHCYVTQMTTTKIIIDDNNNNNNNQNHHPHRRFRRIPMLSISMARFMMYPHIIYQDMMDFLKIEIIVKDKEEEKEIDSSSSIVHDGNEYDQKQNMDPYAELVLQRYDNCTKLLQHLQQLYNTNNNNMYEISDINKVVKTTTNTLTTIGPNQSLNDLLNSIIQNELHRSYCSGDTKALIRTTTTDTEHGKPTYKYHGTSFIIDKPNVENDSTGSSSSRSSTSSSPSRIVEMMDTIFTKDSISFRTRCCTKYPNAHICIQQQQ